MFSESYQQQSLGQINTPEGIPPSYGFMAEEKSFHYFYSYTEDEQLYFWKFANIKTVFFSIADYSRNKTTN